MVPFNKPYMTGKELGYITEAHNNKQLSGDGPFTKRCHEIIQDLKQTKKALLTHSCTAALEMAAILTEVEPGDEVIMPSYTFVSTANAFVLRGGIPVFVDIREDTLNLDENKIEEAITSKTKAIVPVHYAGVGCEMDKILEISRKYNLFVIEDAAQAVRSFYKDKPLGGIGDLGTLSFHETKNITSGEGGALLVNSEKFLERSEIIREKGTNRSKFFRGLVDKYSWVDIGSSYLPGEIIAAFLLAQLEEVNSITDRRLYIWSLYHERLESLEQDGFIRRPRIPSHCNHNAHMYYIILNSENERNQLMSYLESKKISSVFHYTPLHSSQAGRKFGRVSGNMDNTDSVSSCLLRLPIFNEMNDSEVNRVTEEIQKFGRGK